MKRIIMLAVVGAAIFLAVSYFSGGKNGLTTDNAADDVTITEVQKWQDQQGVWHFSNDGVAPGDSEKVQIRSDQNVIKTNYAEQLSALEGGQGQLSEKQNEQPADYSSISTVKQGLETLQKAGGVQSVMDQREQNLELQLESYK